MLFAPTFDAEATVLSTFEHHGRLIYVSAHPSLPRGWAIDIGVVGPNGTHQPHAIHIAWNSQVNCNSLDAAVSRAKAEARAFVDGVCSKD